MSNLFEGKTREKYTTPPVVRKNTDTKDAKKLDLNE